MKPLVIASNMLNEIDEIPGWFTNMSEIADGGILIVDGGSTDGTQEFFGAMKEKGHEVICVIDDIIQREGYGPARNHLRREARAHFPDSHWLFYVDADERISREEYHQLRFLKDYLAERFDVIAFPRIDWQDRGKTHAENDWKVSPDWQARMTRLSSPIEYIRRLHEQVSNYSEIYLELSTPKINHFHRCAPQSKRDYVGKVCAHLHQMDEMGDTYPEHHKEAHYRKLLEKEGL
jgi:glycosyltransferase involved in cell wall biosynthesis